MVEFSSNKVKSENARISYDSSENEQSTNNIVRYIIFKIDYAAKLPVFSFIFVYLNIGKEETENVKMREKDRERERKREGSEEERKSERKRKKEKKGKKKEKEALQTFDMF